MADNGTITPGVGLTVATDDVAGVHYQKVKIADGTADSTNMLKVDSSGAVRVMDAGVNTAFALALTTAVVAVQTGGANLPNRVFIHMQNRGADDVEIGFAPGFALGTGTIIPSGQSAGFSLGPGVTVYARAVAATPNLRVIELPPWMAGEKGFSGER